MLANEGYNLYNNSNATIADSANNIGSELMRISAFSLAKAIGVTGTIYVANHPLTLNIAAIGYNIYESSITTIYDISIELIEAGLSLGSDYFFDS